MKITLKRASSLLLTGFMLASLMSGGVWAEETNAIGGENRAMATGAEIIQTMAVEGDYEYADVTGGVEIASYLGAGENIVVPATLGGKPVVKIGDWAFNGFNHPSCVAIKTITLPAGITMIDDYAFAWCTNLTSINIPTGVTGINGYAFYKCTSLTSVVIPEGVENIWGNAFEECPNITSMVIPESVANIGILVFNKCVGLTSIQFNSATTVINDIYSPIMPNTTKIIGYDPSTAKDYASKYGNPFESLGEPEKGELTGFLGQDLEGNCYLYNKADFNNSYVAYQINPSLAAAKMYQHFVNNKGKIVALKDLTKGYMDYNAAATASLMAQIRGEAFDINAYFGSSDAKLYGGVVTNVGIVDKDGNVTY